MSSDDLKELYLALDSVENDMRRSMVTVRDWAERESPYAADLREAARYCWMAADAARTIAALAHEDRAKRAAQADKG